jgi:hypothetical protein
MEYLIHELNKENFFYQSIATLSFAQFGINEIFSRGFYLKHRIHYPDFNDFVTYIKSLNFPLEVQTEIFQTQTFTPLIFVPGFSTKDKEKLYRMMPDYSAVQFVDEQRGRTKINIELTHMTIICAWEKIITLNLSDSPILQFFRHLRNAAAHNGKFHFDKKAIDETSGKLKRDAEWKTFRITPDLQGLHLIARDEDDKDFFCDQGDIVEFLLDFENHYPQLKELGTK